MLKRLLYGKGLGERLERIEAMLVEIKDKQDGITQDIVRLEQDCIESTNLFYELSNSIDALDARIDTAMLEWIEGYR